jgi:tetratricopeptide (TPR) repeat protein
MSKLSDLVKTKAGNISQQNIKSSKEKCYEADSYIMKARESGGKNKELVQKAVDLYQEALELNSRLVQPYIGLAYISYSAGNLKTAIGLLNKAFDLEPKNTRVNEMLTAFNEEFKQKNVSEVVSKVSGKSLSEKLNSAKKIEINLFEKITAIFIKSTKPKNEPDISFNTEINQKPGDNKAGSNRSNPGNFFENISNLSKAKK